MAGSYGGAGRHLGLQGVPTLSIFQRFQLSGWFTSVACSLDTCVDLGESGSLFSLWGVQPHRCGLRKQRVTERRLRT